MRVTSKGQVTIPVEFREQFGLLPDTEVEFRARGGALLVEKKASPKRQTRGAIAVRLLRGRAQGRMTTDEILALTRG